MHWLNEIPESPFNNRQEFDFLSKKKKKKHTPAPLSAAEREACSMTVVAPLRSKAPC
jgi:hypothetical protein